jgi:hypothetical protein
MRKIYSGKETFDINGEHIGCYVIFVNERFKLCYVPYNEKGIIFWKNDPSTLEEIRDYLVRHHQEYEDEEKEISSFGASKLEDAIRFFSNNEVGEVEEWEVNENFLRIAENIRLFGGD